MRRQQSIWTQAMEAWRPTARPPPELPRTRPAPPRSKRFSPWAIARARSIAPAAATPRLPTRRARCDDADRPKNGAAPELRAMQRRESPWSGERSRSGGSYLGFFLYAFFFG